MCDGKLIIILNISVSGINCYTTVGTSCTTNPQQIEVMELEHYGRPTCNKLCASSHDSPGSSPGVAAPIAIII